MRGLVALALTALLLAAGCLGSFSAGDAGPGDQALNGTGTVAEPNETAPPDEGEPGEEPKEAPEREPPSRTGNETPDERETAQPPWPALADARVRPGVQLTVDGNQCTTNFVFRTPDNATLFIGTAAHCVADGESTNTNGCDGDNVPLPLGSDVQIAGATQPGTLVYSSWETMQRLDESNENACRYNDFALVAIHPDDRGTVHPAMLHFGGPTSVAKPGQLNTGDKLLSYGNSGLRMGLEPTNWHEGYVVERSGAWTLTSYVVSPIVPGDSGSAVITADGEAAGIAVTVALSPLPASNGITLLDTALAYAAEKGGVQVELATWEQLDRGLLP